MPAEPVGRFLIALDDGMKVWAPTWTRIDSHPSLVTSYTIDRGRSYEMDRTDTGRAVVSIADKDGILDPTNTSGPYFGKIEPLRQAIIGRRNPVTGTWHTRFRGWIEDWGYEFDPSQRVNRLTVTLVDIFEIFAAIEMQPSMFGDDPPQGTVSSDVVFFNPAEEVRDRMSQVRENAKIPAEYVVFFSGNVSLFPTSYSPGETPMTVITECADAEFPGVGNVYTDRFGRLAFHGRRARFTPEDLYDEINDTERWDWHTWDLGDRTAVLAGTPETVQLRSFAFERGLAKVINYAMATPLYNNQGGGLGKDLTPADVKGALVTDAINSQGNVTPGSSIDKYGIRSWSAQSLLTSRGWPAGTYSMTETKKFATYYRDNFKNPQNRVTDVSVRSINPVQADVAPKTWEFLSHVDISDAVTVSVGSPGGGGFVLEPFFVEGVHEEVSPLGTDEYDNVTMRLDLSPRAFYTNNPWA